MPLAQAGCELRPINYDTSGNPQFIDKNGHQSFGTDSSGNPPVYGGWNGTFSTGDSRTATVVNGIVTNVA
jgi:hypothetical protein